MGELPEGFEVPIHRSLTEPILVVGLPRGFALLLWTPGMVVMLGLYQVWFLPIQIGLHLAFAYLAQREPHFVEVFKRALRAQRRLDP